MKKFAYPTRILTAAPFMAFALFTLLYLLMPQSITDLPHYLASIVFYTVLPLLAYPVAAVVPRLHIQGRTAERKLAIVFSVIGYLGGVVYLLLCGGTSTEWMVYLTYMISGVTIALFSFAFHFKASGHACGVSGPVAMLAYWLGAPWLACYLLLAVVFWSSLQMKRHTMGQLLVGSMIPVAAMLVLSRLVA